MGYRTLRMAELSFRRQRIEIGVAISSGSSGWVGEVLYRTLSVSNRANEIDTGVKFVDRSY